MFPCSATGRISADPRSANLDRGNVDCSACPTDALVGWFELHDPHQIRAALEAGASPTAPINGKRPVDLLIEMYTRSPKFADCLRVMFDAGATAGDPVLEAVLLDDASHLSTVIDADRDVVHRRYALDSAYTSLQGVRALHVCAEYNSIDCARVLLEAGVLHH